jgi:hypothetical protein
MNTDHYLELTFAGMSDRMVEETLGSGHASEWKGVLS